MQYVILANIIRYENVTDTTRQGLTPKTIKEMAKLSKTSFALPIIVISLVLLLSASSVNSACGECAFIPGAVAYWPMTSDAKGVDLSGNKNHATRVGLNYTDGPSAEVNGASHFNGTSKSFASVTNSPSMDVGKYPGFSFSGFVRLYIHYKQASLIDWSSSKGYGVFIVATPVIQLHLYPNHDVVKHKADFPNQRLTNGSWHFIGLSYEKATGKATVFNDGKHDVIQLDTNIVAGTDKTSEIGLGVDMSDMGLNYYGDMSCMMLFQFALTAEDFTRVWDFCRTQSTQTLPPRITVSNKTTTSAIASWSKSPGIFSGYIITIKRQDADLSQENVHPKFIPSSTTILKSNLTNLVPGATYRVHVWHMQGNIKGSARSSTWFHTTQYLVVDSDSIIFSEITANSAKVSWKDVTGDYDGYTVGISPATGGAMADPSEVLRGTTTTLLRNLSPRTHYTVAITTTSGFIWIFPSTKSFWTREASLVVESDSIIFSEITATSATVSWKDVTGNHDGYSVDISPTTGGAKPDPSILPRGTTTTSLKNLSPGNSYIITIKTMIGSRTSSPSMKVFQKRDLPKDEPSRLLTDIGIGLIATVSCLVVIVIAIAVMVIIILKKNSHNKNHG